MSVYPQISEQILERRRVWTIKDRFKEIEFDGALLGFATSEQQFHSHPVTEDAPYVSGEGKRCSACRWLESAIYRVLGEDEENGRYLIVKSGMSIIPGEYDRHNAQFTDSAYEVWEILAVRKNDGSAPTLPGPSARALAQAASLDNDLENVYINRPAM